MIFKNNPFLILNSAYFSDGIFLNMNSDFNDQEDFE